MLSRVYLMWKIVIHPIIQHSSVLRCHFSIDLVCPRGRGLRHRWWGVHQLHFRHPDHRVALWGVLQGIRRLSQIRPGELPVVDKE